MGAAVAVSLGGGSVALVSATSPADAVTLVPITPCRVMDTRTGDDNVGPRSAPLAADDTHSVDAVATGGDAGDCAGLIPTSATAIALNVTTVGATAGTFLTIWDGSDPRPLASSLNPAPGQPPTPNAVTTDLNTDGEFSIYNLAGTVDVLADITGYYTDHHHDDRYYPRDQTYTQAEVDSAIDDAVSAAATKMIQLPVSSAFLGTNAEYTAINSRAGIRLLDDTSSSSFSFDFVLPPDYTADSNITFELLWFVPDSSCNVRFQRSASTFVREGLPRQAGDIEDTSKTVPSGGFDIVNKVVFDWVPDGDGARAGDGVHVSFYRISGPGDSCDGFVTIPSVAAYYE